MRTLVADISNPFSTGGGGASFEVRIQASFVAAMLCGGRVPSLPEGTLTDIELQTRRSGIATDDALVPTCIIQRIYALMFLDEFQPLSTRKDVILDYMLHQKRLLLYESGMVKSSLRREEPFARVC